jgi:hypothetical protein
MSSLTKNQGISKIWLTNDLSATLIIPIDIARKYDLHRGNHVVVEGKEEGILIRKLKLEAD